MVLGWVLLKKISGWTGGPLRPGVSLDTSDQSVSITRENVCSLESMALECGPPAGISGSWQIDREQECLFSIEPEVASGQWRVGAKVGNSMGCTMTESNGVFSPGPVMSTKMMLPPELQALENSVHQLLWNHQCG